MEAVGVAVAQTQGSGTTDETRITGDYERNPLCRGYGKPMGELTPRISAPQKCVLSLSQMVRRWAMATHKSGAGLFRTTAIRPPSPSHCSRHRPPADHNTQH